MTDWLKHTVQIKVNVPIEFAWSLWADLQQMPLWMKWIESVHILENQPDLSRWKLASGNFEFSWLSRTLKVIPMNIIKWESIDGLPNKGAIRFYDRHDYSIVKLTVAYGIPGILGKIMDNLFLGGLVESTIQEDLKRFKVYCENKYKC